MARNTTVPASPVSLTVLAVVILCGVHRGVEVQHRWRYMKKGRTNATQGISGDSRPLVLFKGGLPSDKGAIPTNGISIFKLLITFVQLTHLKQHVAR